MNTLKVIGLTIIALVKQAWFLPKSLVDAIRRRRQQNVEPKSEVERLDRLRNPSKYLGK